MTAPALAPGTMIGGYVVTGVIGTGVSGVVYVGEDAQGGRVALKVLAPELATSAALRARLLDESRRAASIRHPHVVEVIAAGESDGQSWIASRLVEGRDLRRVVADAGGRLPPERACAILGQVARALDAIHDAGLVHRDVKPANVLVERAGGSEHAYVCDFGLARERSEGSPADAEGLVGTVAYVAPEQIRGDTADGRADQYSLACVLFACLAGRPPFVRESDLAVVYSHLEESPPRLSSVLADAPAEVDGALARGLAKEPGARFGCCRDLVRAVEQGFAGRARPSRRRLAVASGLGLATAALAVLVVALIGSGSQAAGPRPGDVGVLEGDRDSVGALPTKGFVSDLVTEPSGRVLALQPFDRRLLELDPIRRRVVRSFSLGADPGGAPALAAGRIWVSDPGERALLRIRPADGAIERVPLPKAGLADRSEAGNLAFAFGSLWLPDGRSRLERIDPATGRVIARIPVPAAQFAVSGDGQLWVLSPDIGSAFRIDPATNRVVARADVHPPLQAGAVAGGYLWVSIGIDGTVWKIAPDGRLVTAVNVGGDPNSMAARGSSVWVANDGSDSMAEIDASTNAVRRHRLHARTLAVAAVGGRIVFSTLPPSPPSAALPASGPRVIRLLLRQDWLANADPALQQNPALTQLFYATCAKLYNQPDREGLAGVTPIPEVAVGPPLVSGDGRTFRIPVRGGFRFSPPSHEAVDAATFAHVLTRDLAPAMQSDYAARVLGDIVGARAFHRGRAARLSGVSASGNTLTIRLTHRSTDLVARLATTLGCAVPKATPASNTPNGLGPIPMAGPYYLAAWAPGVKAIVRRNPNYAGARPHRLDTIAYELAVPGGDSVERVGAGSADLYAEFASFPYPQEVMPGAHPPAGTHLFRPVALENRFLAVNARSGPFRDRRLRRAVSLALDRPALAALWVARPAQRLIPPPLPGSVSSDRADRPDVAAATRLVGGRHVHARLVTCRIPAPTCAQAAELVRRQLARAGISVGVRLEDDPALAARADLRLGTNTFDSADAADALSPLDHAGPGSVRAIERDGRLDVYARTTFAELTSARLGCVVHNPVYGLADLAALCVR